MRQPLERHLEEGHVLVADGATGTMLQIAGLPDGIPGEAWVLQRPEQIVQLHRAYVDAGSQIILTTTFGGSRPRLAHAGLQDSVTEISRRAAELAREAAGEDVYVAGDIGPTGEMMRPLGRLTFEEAFEVFAEQASALAQGDVDCITIETMSDLNEAKAAVLAAQETCDLPVFCTFSFDTNGHTMMGVSPASAAESMARLGVRAVGANCGHAPEEVLAFLPKMREAAPELAMIAKPNAGLPRIVGGKAVYDATPEQMAGLACQFADLGAQVVGACCGSSPEHIRAIRAAIGGAGCR